MAHWNPLENYSPPLVSTGDQFQDCPQPQDTKIHICSNPLYRMVQSAVPAGSGSIHGWLNPQMGNLWILSADTIRKIMRSVEKSRVIPMSKTRMSPKSLDHQFPASSSILPSSKS